MKKVDMRPVADAVNAYVNGQISEQEFRLLMTAACLSDPTRRWSRSRKRPPLTNFGFLAYNIHRPRMLDSPTPTCKKRTPPEWPLRGGSLCLLALAVTIKPLADAMANYTCCDGHKDAG